MDPLSIVQLVIVALPLLTQLIQYIEDLVNNAGATSVTGTQKKDAVTTLFGQLWSGLQVSGAGSKVLTIPSTQIAPIVSQLIDGVVATFNTLGIFKKATPAAPTA